MGGITFFITKTRLKLLILPIIIVGFFLKNPLAKPDLLVEEQGKLFAVRDTNGRLLVSSKAKARFVREIWQNMEGAELLPLKDNMMSDCRLNYCNYMDKVLIIKENNFNLNQCTNHVLVINLSEDAFICQNVKQYVNLTSLKRRGNLSIWIEKDKMKIVGTKDFIDDRPWNNINEK
ncbi:ComEC/Rec2-related protein [Reticulomyxa filosa]|uniref:ComEC/Rec2-related protein n=1 Tax=Reticulomyxa filosa TaxID=46433 RepID=X6MXR9_RETFI|nr:ComEC/Rec2-related protein [Reticulomyxa filosa]|eukprot:ETO18287.1 ComEC/Rec2-related protein [Reticulomyxa filosa]